MVNVQPVVSMSVGVFLGVYVGLYSSGLFDSGSGSSSSITFKLSAVKDPALEVFRLVGADRDDLLAGMLGG